MGKIFYAKTDSLMIILAFGFLGDYGSLMVVNKKEVVSVLNLKTVIVF